MPKYTNIDDIFSTSTMHAPQIRVHVICTYIARLQACLEFVILNNNKKNDYIAYAELDNFAKTIARIALHKRQLASELEKVLLLLRTCRFQSYPACLIFASMRQACVDDRRTRQSWFFFTQGLFSKQDSRLLLTNRATHLCKCNGVVDLKHAPPHTCYHAQFARSALKDVGIQESPKNWGELKLRSIGAGGVSDPKIHVPAPHQI